MNPVPRLEQANAATYRRTGINTAVAGRSAEVLASAVAGRNHLSREALTDVRKGVQLAVEAHPEALAERVIDGVVHYSAAEGDAGGAVQARPQIDLIQCYDEYVMGYSARRHYMGGNAPAFPFPGEPTHVVLLDGRMAGWWRHTLFPGRCELDIRLSQAETSGLPLAAAVQAAVERYGAFIGLPTVRVQPGA